MTTALHAYLESADPIDAETAIALLDIELEEARAVEPPLPVDPPPGTRLILASENLFEHWGTRTEDGRRLTVEWGEPRPEGWYEPVLTAHADDTLVPIPTAPPALDDLERIMVAAIRHRWTLHGVSAAMKRADIEWLLSRLARLSGEQGTER